MRWPDLLTSRLKRRRADSMGSPSPITILTLGVRERAVGQMTMCDVGERDDNFR